MSVLLADATRHAQGLRAGLLDACERIEIAGSIRRRKPLVKDIELVLIPRWGTEQVQGQIDLFAGAPPERRVNLAQQAIEAMPGVEVIKPGTHDLVPWHLNPEGRYWRLWLPEAQMRVDVFVCTPETWGLNYMIRTGSGVGPSGRPDDGFAPAMLVRWKQVSGGGQARGAQLYDGAVQLRPTPEEADVFEACRVRWVPPEQRLSAADVARAALP
ncbi:MAG: hypothetical protein WC211_01465 [Dehalococcoidia bacterium]